MCVRVKLRCCRPQGNCARVSSINDKSDWKAVRKAMQIIDFTDGEVEVSDAQSNLIGIALFTSRQQGFAHAHRTAPKPIKNPIQDFRDICDKRRHSVYNC